MCWLALHLPQLSLETFIATLDAPTRAVKPVALLAQHRITAVNTVAAECGIRPGCKRATALALSGDLVLGQADAQRDAAALQAVAFAALAFTPAVGLHDDGQTVLMDVSGSLRLFGGLPSLRRHLLDTAVAPLGHAVRSAAAPTALGAAVLARWPDGGRGVTVEDMATLHQRLDSAPVWLLGPGREHWEALQGMGLHTLADLRAMPRSGIARRFGEPLLDELDCAYGLRPDPQRWVELPATFDSGLELYTRADTTDQVLHGASVLLARLVAWGQARHARVAAFVLEMKHEDHPEPTRLRIALAQPSLDAAHLQTLLRERLGHVQLPAPTLELRLGCHELVHASAPDGELFASRRSSAEGLVRLIERLRARLGDEQVQQVQALADHRPEKASRGVPVGGEFGAAQPAAAGPAAGPPAGPCASALPLARPAWVLPEPQPLAERGDHPLLRGRPLRLVSGPERIEAGWWDGDAAARDYFIAEAHDGALVWIWRNRLPAEPGRAHWFLQGMFG
jgi:protein ImuB